MRSGPLLRTPVGMVNRLGGLGGLRMAADEGMMLLAPLTGAALFARFGGAPVAVLDAVTFALAAGAFALLRAREEEPPERTGGRLSDTWEGRGHGTCGGRWR
ncbi:hypothetical protein [Streptomyces sp. NPDC000229]|uniref:hypothetical protein n=1 Tax=Streptomyces sp. NPDC000229 TaxID=3154247 RepID=UPI0033219654